MLPKTLFFRFLFFVLTTLTCQPVFSQVQTSLDIKKLTGTEDYFRGISWQDSKESIKKKEKAILKYENDTLLQYELVLDTQRSIDLLYSFDVYGALKKIETATIFDNSNQELSFRTVLMHFYTGKMGQPLETNNGILIWQQKGLYTIKMVALHDQEDLGTEITYTPN